MGAVFSSCCPQFGHSSGESDEEALLRNQQNGYGSMNGGVNGDNTGYDAVQEQMREHERKLQARDRELRGIVAATNDKLIDISMISNSGIVVQKNDLYTEDLDEEENGVDSESGPNQQDRQDSSDNENSGTSANLTLLADEEVPPKVQAQLAKLHKDILTQLDHQLTVESPKDLTLTF